jgi:RNA polymerase sigma-54 factor
VSGKYMTTPRGLIEFKRFFGTHVLADDGHACSSTAIRALIRQIIAQERAGEPLSDIKVTRKLGEYGVRVARRTVTKYRDAMRIPPVEARRLGARAAAPADDVSPSP